MIVEPSEKSHRDDGRSTGAGNTFANGPADPADWIHLSLIPGLGTTGLWRLISHFKSPAAVLAANKKQLQSVKGIGPRQIAGLLGEKLPASRAYEQLQRLDNVGGQAICYDDTQYPQQLKHLVDPPPVLYVIGDPTTLSGFSVAIVGSRAATAYGRRIAFSLGRSLSEYKLNVVSGLALGIDTQAHLGAIEGEGSTIAVLGCGIDIVYPRQNRSLYDRIRKCGLIVSEYVIGTKPDGFRFPARNRIIAGLCRGVIVVEAARRSGSLITAQIGLDIGREVFAVPGQIDSFKSEGTHWLLQQGAKLVQNVEDVLDELGATSHKGIRFAETGNENFDADLDPDALALLAHIEPYPQQRDKIIEKSGESSSRVSELLLFLELEGFIEMIPGDQLRRL